ncbi:5-formyltetrahydrofolate cyclo-ligase [Sulfurifustis variabilis]|uniref:5-formyltetrahydrofolate cyclo-ligase n=1 Tax=Sulfurifustis variabilis TaxID=1675686 RepID=A0A1C7AFN5_9GAMM|nr:5-formyltetrahydrofolate cyclo-ligase [Sulfurifustis variabilis]
MASADPKSDLRRALRAKRRALTATEQRRASARLAANLSRMRLFRVSRRIAAYLPNDGEIDPGDILERAWRMKKKVYLPVLSRLRHDRLWFAEASPGMELRPNRFGIPEPVVKASALVRAGELDLVLLPLVAFDERGNRIGMGGGFYDKSLAFLRYRTLLTKPHVIGLAHDFQRVDRLPVDPWDVRLAGVVTDEGVYTARS